MKKRYSLITGFFVGLVLFSVGREIWSEHVSFLTTISLAVSWLGKLEWIYDYQTLIAGVAALYGASVAAKAVYAQINQVESIEKKHREAKLLAVRATLPLTLSSLCHYARTSAKLLEKLLLQCENEQLPLSVSMPDFPNVSDYQIAVLKETIEYLDPKSQNVFFELISLIQVQSARIRGMLSDRESGQRAKSNDLLFYTIDCVEIYARCSELFSYARNESETVPTIFDRKSVVSSVHSIGIYSRYAEPLAELARKRE